MKSRDELRRENEALGDRISRLSAAILRSSASLDRLRRTPARFTAPALAGPALRHYLLARPAG